LLVNATSVTCTMRVACRLRDRGGRAGRTWSVPAPAAAFEALTSIVLATGLPHQNLHPSRAARRWRRASEAPFVNRGGAAVRDHQPASGFEHSERFRGTPSIAIRADALWMARLEATGSKVARDMEPSVVPLGAFAGMVPGLCSSRILWVRACLTPCLRFRSQAS